MAVVKVISSKIIQKSTVIRCHAAVKAVKSFAHT